MNGSRLVFPLLLLASRSAWAEPDGQIKRVVIYPDRALVTRAAKLECGNHVIASFPEVPPAADPQSFRATAGNAVVDGVRWQEVIRKQAYAGRAEQLKQKVATLTAELRQSQRDEARFEHGRTTARGYLTLAQWFVRREMSGPRPGTLAWKNALDTAIDSELKATTALGSARIRSRELGRKLDEAQAEAGRLAAAAPPRDYLVEAVVTCPTGGTTQVELSYLVGGAGWTPSYEARAEDAEHVVELKAFATVRQTTGEDWRDAQLILSTAVPRQNATPPGIRPLHVNAWEQEEPKKVLVERSDDIRHSSGASVVVGAGTGTRLQAVAQGLSVQLVVPEPATVAGDGTEARLRFAKNRLPAEFGFRASPKLLPFVFQVADVTNSAPFPILAGSVDLYRGGSFLARQVLDTVASGARFPLSFGVEERLRAKRVVLEERELETGLVSKGRRRIYAYRFHVANYLGRTTELDLSDHIPVSEMKDVVVAVDGKTTAGYRLEPRDGIVRWLLKLAPGEQRAIELAFHVDVPSDYE